MPIYNVCHVCDTFPVMSGTYMRSLSTMSVTSVGRTGSGSKFLPLNFNTSFQFVFHKIEKRKYTYILDKCQKLQSKINNLIRVLEYLR